MTKRATSGRPEDLTKRAAILDAAAELFTLHGFEGVTMDAVAQHAGVSKATVYNHYGNKEQLFQQAIGAYCDKHLNATFFNQMTGADPQKELKDIGIAFCKVIYSAEAIALNRIVISESFRDNTMAALFYKCAPEPVCEKMEQYLTQLQNNQVLQFNDSHRAASVFFSLFREEQYNKLTLNLRDSITDAEIEALAAENAAIFLKIYGRSV